MNGLPVWGANPLPSGQGVLISTRGKNRALVQRVDALLYAYYGYNAASCVSRWWAANAWLLRRTGAATLWAHIWYPCYKVASSFLVFNFKYKLFRRVLSTCNLQWCCRGRGTTVWMSALAQTALGVDIMPMLSSFFGQWLIMLKASCNHQS